MVSIRATAHQKSFMAQTIALICVVVLMLTMSGCKPGATDRFNQAELAFLIKGKTSQQDAIAKLGQPSTSSMSHIGLHQMSWRYDKAAVDGKTYLPFAGTLIGKGTAKPKVISAAFDQHGMLVGYEWSSGTDELTNVVPKP